MRVNRTGLGLLAATMALCLLFSACRFPADPEGTLDRVEGGTMRVGVIDHPPWADTSGNQPHGVEATLARSFADRIGAEIEWVEGAEPELVEALAGFQIDLLIGGLTRSSPYAKEIALTRPYVDTEIQVALPPDWSAGNEVGADDLSGMEIWVERGSAAAAQLRHEEDDAVPVFYTRLSEIDGERPALLDSFEAAGIGYTASDYILRDDEHALAVAPGENAMLVELERFLLENQASAERLLDEETQP